MPSVFVYIPQNGGKFENQSQGCHISVIRGSSIYKSMDHIQGMAAIKKSPNWIQNKRAPKYSHEFDECSLDDPTASFYREICIMHSVFFIRNPYKKPLSSVFEKVKKLTK